MATYSGSVVPTASPERYVTVAVKADGSLESWGKSDEPLFSVPTLTGVIGVATGDGFGVALKSDGTVNAWGTPAQANGQEVVPAGLSGVTHIDASITHVAAVKSDGTVVAWGGSDGAVVPGGLSDVASVAVGENVTVALKSDGTMVEFGFSNDPMPSGISGVYQVSMYLAHALYLKSDGTVGAWGANVFGETDVPAGLSDVVMVAAGNMFSLALKSDGTVVFWGRQSIYDGTSTVDLNPPSGLSNVVAIYAGRENMMAIKDDATVVMWGVNRDSETSPPSAFLFEPLIQDPIDLPEPLDAEISVTIPITFSGSAFQDWAAALPPYAVQEIYTLTVTGSADGVDDITIPISSWQATNQAAPRLTYVQAVIPAAGQYLSALEARSNGDLVIRQGYKFSDGSTKTEEVVRARFDTPRYDEGPSSLTMTVSGYKPGTVPQNGHRTLRGIRSISLSNGKYRVRCKTDLFLKPGMTVTARDKTFQVSYINYYVNGSDRFCEVSDE